MNGNIVWKNEMKTPNAINRDITHTQAVRRQKKMRKIQYCKKQASHLKGESIICSKKHKILHCS